MKLSCRSLHLQSRALRYDKRTPTMSRSLEQDFIDKFSQLWSAYTSRVLETDQFMKEIVTMNNQINAQRLSHRTVAQNAFKNRIHDHIANIMGVLRAISESIRSSGTDSAVKCLAIALGKAEEGIRLPSLGSEKKTELFLLVNSLLSRKRSSFITAKDIAKSNADSYSAANFSIISKMSTSSAELSGTRIPPKDFHAEFAAEANEKLISERYKTHFSLVSYCLQEIEYLKGLTLPGNLANEIFSTALLNGECSFARVVYERSDDLKQSKEAFTNLIKELEDSSDWASIATLLIKQRQYHIEKKENLHFIDTEQIKMVQNFLRAGINEQNAIYSNAVIETCIQFDNRNGKSDVAKAMKRNAITKFLSKTKWRFAMTVANSEDAKTFLYNSLREQGNFSAAKEVFDTYRLNQYVHSYNLKITTPQDLKNQELLSSATLLRLPESVLNRGVILVNSKESLEEAARVLGLTLGDQSPSYRYKKPNSSFSSDRNVASDVFSEVEVEVSVGVKNESENRHKNDNENGNGNGGNSGVSDNYSDSGEALSIRSSSGSNNNNNNNNQSAPKSSNLTPISASLSRLPLSSIRLYVGVDSEWKAVMLRKGETSSPHCQQGAAILQVATADRVMIFDFHVLGKVGPRGWGFKENLSAQTVNLLKQLFQSEDICKVGWDFSSSDITMLKKSGGGEFADAFTSMNNMLELTNLLTDLGRKVNSNIREKKATPSDLEFFEKFPPSGNRNFSLTKACEGLLGKGLNKECQMSDWEAVRLSPSQIQYAALDAHCLLGLLDVLLDRLGARSDEIIPRVTGIPYDIGVRGMYDVPGYTSAQTLNTLEAENKSENSSVKTSDNKNEDKVENKSEYKNKKENKTKIDDNCNLKISASSSGENIVASIVNDEEKGKEMKKKKRKTDKRQIKNADSVDIPTETREEKKSETEERTEIKSKPAEKVKKIRKADIKTPKISSPDRDTHTPSAKTSDHIDPTQTQTVAHTQMHLQTLASTPEPEQAIPKKKRKPRIKKVAKADDDIHANFNAKVQG